MAGASTKDTHEKRNDEQRVSSGYEIRDTGEDKSKEEFLSL